MFKQHPRDPANFDACKNMCDPYMLTTEMLQVNRIKFGRSVEHKHIQHDGDYDLFSILGVFQVSRPRGFAQK